MAHEIEANDNVVLHKEAAWHGLGLVIDKALTPHEAADLVFPWHVIQTPLRYTFKGLPEVVDDFLLNVRSDDGTQLGVVSQTYKVVQPHDMADFAEALLDNGEVKIETAGSIRSGKRLWFLLKGEEFAVANNDSIYPYILLSNGYDGLTTFRVTPTTVRTVCSNTLHMSIPHHDTGTLGQSAISIRHTTNAMDRIEDAKKALAGYGKALDKTKELINILVAKDVTSDSVKQFFLECYTADYGDIPDNPKDGYEKRRRSKAMSAFNSFSKRFDDDRQIAGANMWNAFNAYSGLVQHDQKSRGKDDVDRVEKRVESNLFGLNQERTFRAAQNAFRMALAS